MCKYEWIIRITCLNAGQLLLLQCRQLSCLDNALHREDSMSSKHEIYARVNSGPLIEIACKRQLKWLGHILRKDDTVPAKQLALYEPEKRHGSAERGAPPPS